MIEPAVSSDNECSVVRLKERLNHDREVLGGMDAHMQLGIAERLFSVGAA